MKKKVDTTFSLAWSDYKSTRDYRNSADELLRRGMESKYIDNILHLAFTAGFRAAIGKSGNTLYVDGVAQFTLIQNPLNQ